MIREWYLMKIICNQKESDIMNEEKSFPKTSINCLITIYLTSFTKPYFQRNYENLDNVCFI